MIVFVDHERTHHVGIRRFHTRTQFLVVVDRAILRGRHRRNAHGLACLHPCVGFCSRAVEADLTRAARLLDLALSETVKLAFQPAIETRVVLVRLDAKIDDLPDIPAHPSTRFAIIRPMATAASPAITEPAE